jgi:glutathione S-transferase
MRRLYQTGRSPYARKVALVLREKGLSYDTVAIDLSNRAADYYALHPTGKVPVFEDDDGTVVFDSTVIVEYLEDRYPGMRGQSVEERLASRIGEQLGDELADQAVAAVFAGRAGNDAGKARAEANVDRLLARIRDELGKTLRIDSFGLGEASVVAALGYMTFRLGSGWKDRFPDVAAFSERHHARESVRATIPAE